MSNFLAIASVTATLQRTLQAAVQADVAGAQVTTLRPAEGDAELPTTGVNLFLYQVTPNASWRNDDLMARRPSGEVAVRPRAALDLHYLCSFYGNEGELEPQRLLGSTAAFLHSRPLLTRAAIAAAVADPARPWLAPSDLDEQVDLVRFAPLPMNLEELGRLWSVLFQVKYVLSVAYQASVVLVEREEAATPPLPTRRLNLGATPLQRPRIHRITAAAGEGAPILAGSGVVILGEQLAAEAVSVWVDDAELSPTSAQGERLAVTLPDDIAAGPHRALVEHGTSVGDVGPRAAAASDPEAFVVQPAVGGPGGGSGVVVSNVTGTGSQPRSADVAVTVTPAVRSAQAATLELLAGGAVARTVLSGPHPADTTTLGFAVVDIAAGSYVARVRVDGAESPVEVDADGTPTGPLAVFP